MSALPEPRLLLQTPLHARTAAACLANDWTAEGRYIVARSYRSAGEEAAALVARAGLADISPMVKYRFAGKDAEAALEHLCATRVAGLEKGEVRKVLWCDDDGMVVGDGTLLRVDMRVFLLFTRLANYAWLADGLSHLDARIEDVSGALAGMALFGPLAQAVLNAAGLSQVAKLGESKGAVLSQHGLEIIAARREVEESHAYALWTAAPAAPALWDRLMAAGAPLGLVPVGSAACEGMRLEAGEPRLGVDYLPAARVVPPASPVDPYALGLSALVDRRKPRFVGHAALAQPREAPLALVRIAIDGSEAAPGLRVLGNGRTAGFTTSAAYSLRFQCGLAFAWVERAALGQALTLALPPAFDKGAEPRLVSASLAPQELGTPAGETPATRAPPELLGRSGERPAPPERAVPLS
jgi:aminomethyltransferase